MKNYLVRPSLPVFGAAAAVFPQETRDVLFDFSVPGAVLPAGHYSVEMRGAHSIVLRSPSGAASFVAAGSADSPAPPARGRLVFHHYGGQYFLWQVWNPGSNGREIRPTKQERSLAQAPANVVIAAK